MAYTDYAGLLNQAQGMYGTILGGYNQALASQQANQQGIMQGYNQLQSQVLGGIAGAGKARSAEIADQYTARAGQEMQGLISRGLGNTTVQNAVGRGLMYDQSKSQNQLSEQVAQQNAQYLSQLGLAGLGFQNTANQQNTALQGQQLGYSAGWQQNLLGAAMQGQGREDQMSNQYLQTLLGGMGAPQRVGGGGGGGSVAGTRYPSSYGGGRAAAPAREDPMVANPFYEGGGGMGMGEGGTFVHPGNFSAASLVGDVLGAGLSGGGMDALGGLGAMAGGDWGGGQEDWYGGMDAALSFWE